MVALAFRGRLRWRPLSFQTKRPLLRVLRSRHRSIVFFNLFILELLLPSDLAAKMKEVRQEENTVSRYQQQFRLNGPVTGYRGASGYAPGRLYRLNGSVAGHRGFWLCARSQIQVSLVR